MTVAKIDSYYNQSNYWSSPQAGHVWQRDELVVSFITGSVLIWLGQQRNIQTHIDAPAGVDFEFKSFALSR